MSSEPMKITPLDAFGNSAKFVDVPIKETLAQRRRREITESKNKPITEPRYHRENFCENHQCGFDPTQGCLYCEGVV